MAVARLKDTIARQLSKPTAGFMGWITTQLLKLKNSKLEENAARLCEIQPHHNVLEIGFGPGIGLQHAVQYVQDGPGRICGLELSTYMIEKASSSLRRPICDNKVELTYGSVIELPYSTDTFDKVFHCNSYYFWSSMQMALSEIHRVMKPGAVMVTLIDMDSVKVGQARGFLKYGNPDPINYMCALELTGFKDVKMEYLVDGSYSYQAIFAYLPVKEAENESDQLDLELKETKPVEDTKSLNEMKPGEDVTKASL